MQIDPQAELTLKLTDDGKAYSFKPWSYRQQRQHEAWMRNKDLENEEYSSRVVQSVCECYSGSPEEIEDLPYFSIRKLFGLLYAHCFIDPEDKKKSES